MKKRAPTLPPTIIDRGLSMIAMRVTFSRACARARKKKVILYARANARKCAREKVKRKWKKNAFFRYRYKSFSFSFSFFSPQFSQFFLFLPKNKRRERICKKAYFPAPSSCERFMRCTGASARFSAPLSRARSPDNARAWMGQGSDDVSRSRANLVLCLVRSKFSCRRLNQAPVTKKTLKPDANKIPNLFTSYRSTLTSLHHWCPWQYDRVEKSRVSVRLSTAPWSIHLRTFRCLSFDLIIFFWTKWESYLSHICYGFVCSFVLICAFTFW